MKQRPIWELDIPGAFVFGGVRREADPEIATLVWAILSAWASIDARRSSLAFSLIGANQPPAYELLAALHSKTARNEALLRATSDARPDEFDLVEKVCKHFQPLDKTRNELAYNVSAISLCRPDVLILIDPKHTAGGMAMYLSLEWARTDDADDPGRLVWKTGSTGQQDEILDWPRHAYYYTIEDLRHERDAMRSAHFILRDLEYVLIGESDPDPGRVASVRARLHKALRLDR